MSTPSRRPRLSRPRPAGFRLLLPDDGTAAALLATARVTTGAGLPEDGPLIAEVKRIEEGIPVYGKAHLGRAA